MRFSGYLVPPALILTCHTTRRHVPDDRQLKSADRNKQHDMFMASESTTVLMVATDQPHTLISYDLSRHRSQGHPEVTPEMRAAGYIQSEMFMHSGLY